MNPYQLRVIEEKEQLDEKLAKLILFFTNPIYLGLDDAEKVRLKRQVDAMGNYSAVLRERISAF